MKRLLRAAVLLACLASVPAAARAAPRWEEMDYGPFLSSSVTMQYARDGEDAAGIVMKGVTVPLRHNGKVVAAACFDTMLCRWAGGWLAPADGGPPLKLYGTPFDGTHRPPERSRPRAQGPLVFQTPAVPGWSADADFVDRRLNPYVPLPKGEAHYSGLYRHGGAVVFKYTVGATEVLERVSAVPAGKAFAIVRELSVGPHAKAVRFLVAAVGKEPGFATAVERTGGAAGFERVTGGIGPGAAAGVAVALAPAADAATFRVTYVPPSAGAAPDPAPPATDFAALTKGGPAAYPTPVVTAGKLGKTGQAYEVDAIVLPTENPWKAWMRPGGFDLFAGGRRAALCTWSGDVWVVDGLDDTLAKLAWHRVAAGLFQPLGLRIVDDVVYVLGRDGITRLRDLDGDGEADFYENFNNDVSCTANFHEFATDLQTDAAGNFYFVKNAPLLGTDKWDPAGPHNGCVLRVAADGTKLDVVATGIRAANGMGVGPRGEVTTGDNEGIWTPVCRVNWVRPGMFLGAVGMDHRPAPPTTYDPPLCWLPFAVDNSAAGQVWTGGDFGPLGDALLHLSYGKCAIFRVLPQEVEGTMQGGVTKLPWAFDASCMRARFNAADHALYVAGLRGWQTTAAQDGAFHRVRYTGKPFATVTKLAVRPGAIELTFSVPLDREAAADAGSYDVQHWNYRWTERYGSDHFSPTDPARRVGQKGELKGEPLEVAAAALSADGTVVTLTVPKLRTVMQVLTRARLKTAAGADLPVDVSHTINRLSVPAGGRP